MMIFNMRDGPVRTQITSTQKTNNYEMSKQNIPNLQVFPLEKIKSKVINAGESLSYVCSTDEIKSKRVHVDESESKNIDADACSMDKSE